MYKQDGFLYTTSGPLKKHKNIIEEVKDKFDNDLIVGIWVVVEKEYPRYGWQPPNHVYEIGYDGVTHDQEDILIEFVNGKIMAATNSEWGGIYNVDESY